MSNGNQVQGRPQAQDDRDDAFENGFILINVLANDRGAAREIWSLDQDDPTNNDVSQRALPSGSAILVRNGVLIYKVAQYNFDYLAAGETATDSFTYSIRMGDGTYSSATVEVLIHGINDPASIAETSIYLVEGDSADDLSTSGTVAIDDVDGPDSFIADTQVGYYGTFTIDEAGNWTFTAHSAYDEFEEGNYYGEAFTIYSADGTPGWVGLNFLGTAEEPAMLNGFAAPDLVAYA